MYSESCAFDYASVTFNESDGYVTVLTGREDRVGNASVKLFHAKSQRLKGLAQFLAVMRARSHRFQVRSDIEEALKHVLKHTCGERVHLEYSNTFWKLLHPLVEVNAVFEP